jgi:predicted house-cleaning noncanonical NTP pyrophosphatase (MazG superfamily)
MRFDKLVRDNIPDILSKDQNVIGYGVSCEHSKETIEFYTQEKLHEEADEVCEAKTPQELTTELADLLEVMQKYAQLKGIHWDDVLVAQQVKAGKVGKFERNIILKEIVYKNEK